MHARLIQIVPSITLKKQLCERTCQSMRPVDFEELGLSSSKGQVLGGTKRHEPAQKFHLQRRHWKLKVYIFFLLPFYTSFCVAAIYRLALIVVLLIYPRHRGGGATTTWELVLWHSGSSRARCNSKRSSCKGGRQILLFLPYSWEFFVENYPKWKETNIGDTPIFHWTMIMGGRVFKTVKSIAGRWQDGRLTRNSSL